MSCSRLEEDRHDCHLHNHSVRRISHVFFLYSFFRVPFDGLDNLCSSVASSVRRVVLCFRFVQLVNVTFDMACARGALGVVPLGPPTMFRKAP